MIGVARVLAAPRAREAREEAAVVAEFVSADELRGLAPEWAALCARALEPNPFAEPGFLLPLIAYDRPKRLAFVAVRRGGRWIGFAALLLPRLGLGRVWMSPYAALPAAAFDRAEAVEALAAVAALLARSTRLSGIVWPFVERDGAFAAALREFAARRLPLQAAGGRRRAALRLAGAAGFDADLNPKRRTKWARKARTLSGRLETTPGPQGIEAFFQVERRGWKGERRTALADDPARAAFARTALENFAREGRLDALTLRLDGAPIAAGLALTAGSRAFYWKTAYDEAYAEASPGIQLTLAHSRRLAEAPGLTLADSCAVEDHPMIGRVWGDALAFEDMALALRPAAALGAWLRLARAKAGASEQAKAWIKRALGRKRT
jgi:hypothetical protein